MDDIASRLRFIIDLCFGGKQAALAMALDVSAGTISRWLNTGTVPDGSSLARLKSLGINSSFLLGSGELFDSSVVGEMAKANAEWTEELQKRYLKFLESETSHQRTDPTTRLRESPGVYGDWHRRTGTAPTTSIYKQLVTDRARLAHDLDQLTVDALTGADVVIPMLESNIPAGVMVPIYEDLATSFNVTSYYRDCFTMRVKGDSMIGAGIEDGDRVVIKRGHRFRDGDVIAALVDGEITLKGVWKVEDRIYLVPANPKYPKFEVPEHSDFQCLGVCIDTFRPPKKVNWE